MAGDNRVFNVNGKGPELLAETIKLAFACSSSYSGITYDTCTAWKYKKDKGLILYSCFSDTDKDINKFPGKLSYAAAANMVIEWLESKEAAATVLDGWDKDADHDGSNSKGWRVYVEDWGRVGGDFGVICAVTPAFIWHGK